MWLKLLNLWRGQKGKSSRMRTILQMKVERIRRLSKICNKLHKLKKWCQQVKRCTILKGLWQHQTSSVGELGSLKDTKPLSVGPFISHLSRKTWSNRLTFISNLTEKVTYMRTGSMQKPASIRPNSTRIKCNIIQKWRTSLKRKLGSTKLREALSWTWMGKGQPRCQTIKWTNSRLRILIWILK